VGAGREPLAHQADDARIDAGQFAREFDPVAFVEAAADRIVLPGDAEEVDRIQVPQAGLRQPLTRRGGDQGGVLHLRDGRDDHAPLATAGRGALDHRFVHLVQLRIHAASPC
jgi:hypothetical protein